MSIQAGDLVYVAKPTLCCGVTVRCGNVFRVVAVECPPSGWIHCPWCDRYEQTNRLFALAPDGRYCDLERLRKIPPLGELDAAYDEVTKSYDRVEMTP